MSLTCLREVPTLAKRMKKLLRTNKINLNVQVLDKNRNVIDSDIEEMDEGTWFNEPDDPTDDKEDDEDDDDEIAVAPPPPPRNGAYAASPVPPAPPPPGNGTQAVPPARPPPGVAQDLEAQLKTLQLQVATLPPAAEKVSTAFKAAVALLRGGDAIKAEQLGDTDRRGAGETVCSAGRASCAARARCACRSAAGKASRRCRQDRGTGRSPAGRGKRAALGRGGAFDRAAPSAPFLDPRPSPACATSQPSSD